VLTAYRRVACTITMARGDSLIATHRASRGAASATALAAVAAAALLHSAQAALTVQVNVDASYALMFDGVVWFNSSASAGYAINNNGACAC
jgi:hypothetical protein